MNDVIFHDKAFKEYMEWQTADRKILQKINALIEDIQRNGLLKGIGKPEALKHMKAYSRRIDDVNRLVYTADENKICLSCPAKVITNNPCPVSFVHEGISLEEFLLIQAAKFWSSFLRDGDGNCFPCFFVDINIVPLSMMMKKYAVLLKNFDKILTVHSAISKTPCRLQVTSSSLHIIS